MKTIRDIEYVEGVKILIRTDFNVPISNGVVGDDFRIRVALPTIQFFLEKGARIILISHAESNDKTNPSLKPIADKLGQLGVKVHFVTDYKKVPDLLEQSVKNGECILLENLRHHEGEVANDKAFAKELASFADIYVNEAFPVSHRDHASVVGIPQFLPSYAGLQFEKEVMHLSKAFTPAHPFLFILGGAKFDTKLPLIERFTQLADTIFIGGALANDGLRAKGYTIGDSTVSKGIIDITHIIDQPNILLPADVVVQGHTQKNSDAVSEHDKILDSGTQTIEIIREKIKSARFILWNGTIGLCEDGYVEGTEAIAKMIGEATINGRGSVESIVGGGDTIAAIAHMEIAEKFTFVSSGGGAMLDFLAKGTLPGIEALQK